jgi:hypothetical protein
VTTNAETLSNSARYTYANATGGQGFGLGPSEGPSNPAIAYTTTLCGKLQKVKNFALVLFGELKKLPAAKPNDPDGYPQGSPGHYSITAFDRAGSVRSFKSPAAEGVLRYKPRAQIRTDVCYGVHKSLRQ